MKIFILVILVLLILFFVGQTWVSLYAMKVTIDALSRGQPMNLGDLGLFLMFGAGLVVAFFSARLVWNLTITGANNVLGLARSYSGGLLIIALLLWLASIRFLV